MDLWRSGFLHALCRALNCGLLCRFGLIHGLLARDGKHYSNRLTEKGSQIALLFILSHKQPCGPLANSAFHHQSAAALRPNRKVDTAFHKADHSIQNIIQLPEAA
jgi:hypothetical protein